MRDRVVLDHTKEVDILCNMHVVMMDGRVVSTQEVNCMYNVKHLKTEQKL